MAERSNTFLDLLDEKQILVADGAMGTALFEGGLEPGGSPELVNVEDPPLIESVHRSYIDTPIAGALTTRRLRFMGKDVMWKRRCISKSADGFVLEGNLKHTLKGDTLHIEGRYQAKQK